MDKIRQKFRAEAFVIAFGLATSNQISAQIVTDGSTGAQVTLNGQDVTIEESLGTRAGSNLFHSFDAFNISTGGSATFIGRPDIQNVISRVTGGEVSNIQGTLRSDVGNADFYFINPAGVTFGEGGSVDVPASFHLSTKDELRFADGSVLKTASPTTSVLSISTPRAFGYLSEGRGAIRVSGAQIEVLNGDLGVTSNEILIDDGMLASLGGINIEVSGRALIENGGTIATAAINDSDGSDVNLNANELLINGQGTGLRTGIYSSVTSGSGNGGDINLTIAETATIRDGGEISSRTDTEGDGGTIELTANEVQILNGGAISRGTLFAGNSGNILLTANHLFIDGQEARDLATGIFGLNNPGSTGNAGNISISIAELATIQNRGRIVSRTFSDGNAGDVTLTARQVFISGIDGEEDLTLTFTGVASLSEFGAAGDAGSINVFIDELATIQNGGIISTSTFAEGNAGNIQLSANQLLIDAQNSERDTGIASSAGITSTGNAGMIDISISDLATILSRGRIDTSTFSQGSAGVVRIDANRLEVDGEGSAISSNSITESGGDAGTVIVSVDEELTLQNGGFITTFSNSNGDAGSVRVNSTTGSIRLIQDSGLLSVTTGDDSNAGDVTISTGGMVTIDDSIVWTVSLDGTSGRASINAGTLDINNSSILTTTISPVADGGNVSIDTEVLILKEALIQANALSGNGGTITIDSDAVIPFANQLDIQPIALIAPDDASANVIQAVAESGVTIPPTINAPETDISAALAELNANPGDAPTVASDPCAAFIDGAPSSLVESGRGGLPVTGATVIELPVVAAQVSFTERQLSLSLNDTDASGDQPTGCRSG